MSPTTVTFPKFTEDTSVKDLQKIVKTFLEKQWDLSKGNIIDLADYFKGRIVNVFLLKAVSPSSKDGEPENLPTKPTTNASATKLTKPTALRSLLGGLDSSVDTLWQKITGGGSAPPLLRISKHREGGGVADGALDGTTVNGDKKEEVYDGTDDVIKGTPPKKLTLDGDENGGKGGEVIGNALHDMEDSGARKEDVGNEDIDDDGDEVGNEVVDNDEDKIDDDEVAGEVMVEVGEGGCAGGSKRKAAEDETVEHPQKWVKKAATRTEEPVVPRRSERSHQKDKPTEPQEEIEYKELPGHKGYVIPATPKKRK